MYLHVVEQGGKGCVENNRGPKVEKQIDDLGRRDEAAAGELA